MKVLITGGCGFIGSHLVDKCVDLEYHVVVLDNLATGRKKNIPPMVEFHHEDIRDTRAVQKAMRGCEVVFHLAALPSVPRSLEEPSLTSAVNLGGTVEVLEAARHLRPRRVVFASSSSIYGSEYQIAQHELMATYPRSPYAVQKLASEWMCNIYRDNHGLSTISLRYFNVYGPRQSVGHGSDYAAVIPKFIAAKEANEPAIIYGDGNQTRAFTHVSDVVAATLKAAEEGTTLTGSLNVACQKSRTVKRLHEIVGSPIPPRFEPPRLGEIKHSAADISKALQFLRPWKPEYSLERGVVEMME
jgi:nucleoside-diphosphate-sugar epimerase